MTIHDEIQMFDCTEQELKDYIQKERCCGHDMPGLVMSLLSDVQEMLRIGLDHETARRALNRAKYLLAYERSR